VVIIWTARQSLWPREAEGNRSEELDTPTDLVPESVGGKHTSSAAQTDSPCGRERRRDTVVIIWTARVLVVVRGGGIQWS
jgi:hypothetical protein